MRRQLGDGDADVGELALDLVAVGDAVGRLVEIEQPLVPRRDLDALVAVALGPAGDGFERIVRRGVSRKLGEEQAGSLERLDGRLLRLPAWLLRPADDEPSMA
jgi:hypothetical protein